MSKEHIYTISELNKKARGILEQEIGPIWLQGEVSNFTRAPSGHLYFTLKDSKAEISAVRFKGRSALLPTPIIENGMEIIAYGNLTLYEPRGRYQFIVSLIQPAGMGSLQLSFEQLKKQLKAEGLFDESHKKPLPQFPKRIGVITSPTGAAIRDILSVLKRRWPLVEVYLFGSSVQGKAAAEEIIAAIEQAKAFSSTHLTLDLLIVGRGGGSLEDLAVFNDERVARAIFACEIPVVSAVGHEIDFVISDLVADLRAPTPSAAAELIIPDRSEVLSLVTTLFRQSLRRMRTLFDQRDRILTTSPRKVDTLNQRLDISLERLLRSIKRALKERVQREEKIEGILQLCDPNLPLRRGYSLTFIPGDTRPLRDGGALSPGDEIETRLLRATIRSRVKEVKKIAD
jgi:exodeoxyribonuclease VII large subunit